MISKYHKYSDAQTKSGSLSSNLTFWGALIRPLRGLTQQGQGTHVGAGSPWLEATTNFLVGRGCVSSGE
jgi:hypothetical protein